ncbi:MAG: phytoene/squalene synthase family protein [Hyphomicrobiales bacterium]|nr:MAG: phytoene/squalene synthase family protein [Hyphomicrobiales bacterium]
MRASAPDPRDIEACLAALKVGSASFHLAGLLLPRRVRDHASALYAFCRIADDVADTGGRRESIEALRRRLQDAYAGFPQAHPVDRAFAAVVACNGVPRALPEALIEGLLWDIEGRTYDTLADLEKYAARVAGSVGAMMAVVMGVRTEEALARACDLGVAMQLTNIVRDIGEDARMGRLYLPRALLRGAGIDPDAWRERPVWDAAIAQVVQRLLARADLLYARARGGIAHLPRSCRMGIQAARLIYADIGTVARASGFNPLIERAVVPVGRKLSLVGAAAHAALLDGRGDPCPPLEATRFLVSAAARPQRQSERREESRIIWLLDLFERLERRERA